MLLKSLSSRKDAKNAKKALYIRPFAALRLGERVFLFIRPLNSISRKDAKNTKKIFHVLSFAALRLGERTSLSLLHQESTGSGLSGSMPYLSSAWVTASRGTSPSAASACSAATTM